MVRGLDLRDLFTGRMSLRRFEVILNRLPPDSHFKADRRDEADIDWDALPDLPDNVHGPWSMESLLLARLVDELSWSRWEASDRKTDPPAPVPRPGVKPRQKVTPINPAAYAYLRYLEEHRGEAPPPGWKPAI